MFEMVEFVKLWGLVVPKIRLFGRQICRRNMYVHRNTFRKTNCALTFRKVTALIVSNERILELIVSFFVVLIYVKLFALTLHSFPKHNSSETNRKKTIESHNNCFFKFTITFTYAHKIIETSDVMLKIHFLFFPSYINISYHLTLERNTDFYTAFSFIEAYVHITTSVCILALCYQGWFFYYSVTEYIVWVENDWFLLFRHIFVTLTYFSQALYN